MDDKPARTLVDQATAHFIARLNAVPVKVEDLFLAAAEIQKLPLETCNRAARVRCAAQIFNECDYKAVAVNSRLEAMARIVKSAKLRRWVRPNMVEESVFKAAAKVPLLFTENVWFFEHDSFVACVLGYSHVDGHS